MGQVSKNMPPPGWIRRGHRCEVQAVVSVGYRATVERLAKMELLIRYQ
jgi:hypothetical protein